MAATQHTVDIPFLREPAVHTVYENGYQFIYVPKRGEVFNISTWVKTGSLHEDAQNSGVSHFLEHLMFKGTERFAPGAFDKAMESMGAVINAATWKDFTYYYITGPQGNAGRNFAKAMDMHADMLLFSTLPEAEIGQPHDPHDPQSTADKRERGVVIEEIGMREDQPWTKIYNLLNHMMYPDGHPYQREVIGTRDIIATIPRADIMRYYTQWYSPANCCTIVVGDFDFSALEVQLLASFDFSKQPRNGHAGDPPTYPDCHVKDETRFAQAHGEFQTTFMMTGYHAPLPTNLKETIALDIAGHVLGEGRSSRLYQALIERPDVPVFNMASCGQSTFRLGNVFYVQANFNSPDQAGCLEAVHRELSDFRTTRPVTVEEFQRAVKKMKVDFAETSETASGIAEAIGESLTISDTLDEYVRYLPTLAEITLEDVRDAACRWLDPDKAYTAVMAPANTSEGLAG